jgi:4-amino-4-deoxy-L-arabinose transferase-like glycosyltransferase
VPAPSRSGWIAVLAIGLVLALLAPGLGDAPFDDPGEGQHAEIAREMRDSGDWLILRLNGVRYLDKPPLLYWLVAGAFAVLGEREWAARIAPLLGAAAAAAGTAVLGARLLGPRAGFAAAAALLSSTLFLVFGRYVRPETLFVAAIQWGFTGLLIGLMPTTREPRDAGAGELDDDAGRRRWLVVGCAGLGLAALAKDTLGLVGPILAVTVALALAGRLRWSARRVPWLAAAVLVVLGGGWYLAAAFANPGFVWYTVVDNHLLNVVRLRHFPDEDVPLTSPEFLAVTALGAFPWIIPAALQVAELTRRRAWRDPDETPWVALALWTVALVGFFALAPFKLPHYALPAYPAIALLAVRYWRSRLARPRALLAMHLACFTALAAGALVVATGDGRAFVDAVFSTTDVYTRKEIVANQASPLPPWSALAPLVMRAGLITGAAALVLAVALALGAGRLGFAAVLGAMLAMMPLATAATALVATGRAVAAMATDVKRRIAPGDLLVHEGPIENSGALELYSGRRPVLLDARRSVLGMGATYEESSGAFLGVPELARVWQSGRRVYLVTPRGPAQSLVASLPRDTVHLVAATHGRWLYSNVRDGGTGR